MGFLSFNSFFILLRPLFSLALFHPFLSNKAHQPKRLTPKSGHTTKALFLFYTNTMPHPFLLKRSFFYPLCSICELPKESSFYLLLLTRNFLHSRLFPFTSLTHVDAFSAVIASFGFFPILYEYSLFARDLFASTSSSLYCL